MSLSYDVMVWHPDNIGARDDAFASGWTPTSCVATKIDGDYIKLEQAGLSEAIIPAGETYVVVDHGCISTPKIIILPRDDLGGRRSWVSDENASTFQINIDSQDGVDHAFDWGDPALPCFGGAGGLGYIEKTGISVDPSDFPYLVLGLEGTDKYWVEVYESAAWNTIISATAAPSEYEWVVHYLGDLGLGTITGIRLGIAEVPNAELTYDFFEFHRRFPHFPQDLVKGHVYQRELGADVFELEAVMNRYVGADVVFLTNFEENMGDETQDESSQQAMGDFPVSDPAWVSTEYGYGLEFDATNKRVDFDTPVLTPDALTVIAWFKRLGNSWFENHNLITRLNGSDEDDHQLLVNQAGTKAIFKIKDSGGTPYSPEQTIADPTIFNMVAGVWDGTNAYAVVNKTWGSPIAVGSILSDPGTRNPRVGGMESTWYSNGQIAAMIVFNRALSAAELTAIYDAGPPNRFYVQGRYIRIALARGSEKEKIFAGVIENATPEQGKIVVEGRCFQVIAQRATRSEDFNAEDLDSAVTTIAAGLGITFDRVEAPFPQIKVTKKYNEPFVSNVLDELASLPSKQTPYEAWRWKVGYGRDLRFRAVKDADVRVCTTTVSSGTNLLRGILRGSDIYELANKVIAVSGPINDPEDDDYCEDTTGWTTVNCTINATASAGIRAGTTALQVVGGTQPYHAARRSIPVTDASELKKFVIETRWATGMVDAPYTVDVRLESASGGFFYYKLLPASAKGVDALNWIKWEIYLDDPNWVTSGSPSWTDIDAIRLYAVNGVGSSFYWHFDNAHFEVDNLQREATETGTEAAETRVFVYTDESIRRVQQIQDLANALVKAMMEGADRWVLPVIGYPDLQRGRKLMTDVTEMNITGYYYIAEAEHLFGRGIGYEVWVLLSRGKFNLSLELAKTLQTDLRRSDRGGVDIPV